MANDQQYVVKKLQEEKVVEMAEKSFQGVQVRTKRHTFTSEERRLFFVAIYSWLCPEFTAYVFCSKSFPTLTSEFIHYFTRFLFSKGDCMDKIRGCVAEVMSSHKDDTTLIKEFIRKFNSSMTSWNKTRSLEKHKLHVLLNYHNLERRFCKRSEQLAAIRRREVEQGPPDEERTTEAESSAPSGEQGQQDDAGAWPPDDSIEEEGVAVSLDIQEADEQTYGIDSVQNEQDNDVQSSVILSRGTKRKAPVSPSPNPRPRKAGNFCVAACVVNMLETNLFLGSDFQFVAILKRNVFFMVSCEWTSVKIIVFKQTIDRNDTVYVKLFGFNIKTKY
jgi:hypothetical protein